MNQPFISIIIPCYNVANYIPQSFKTVLTQTYLNWECIAVDDGSTDETVKEINLWTQRDDRFKLICQKNTGPAGARNTGLDHASGDLIFFFDADDLLDEQCLQSLLNAYKPSADIVIGNNAKVLGQTTHNPKPMEHFSEEEKLASNCNLLILSLKLSLSPVVWNKLYNRKFILLNNLRFKEVLHEDELWFFETMHLANKVIFNTRITYFYNIDNQDSITKNYSFNNLEAYLKIIEDIFNKYYSIEENKLEKKVIGTYILHLQINTISAFFRFIKKEKVGYKSNGILLIESHLSKYQIEDFSYLDKLRTKQFKIFIKYAASNPETAFKLIRNTNKINILKFFENMYLKINHSLHKQ